MSEKHLEVRFLKKIGPSYRDGRVYAEADLAGFDRCWEGCPEDAYRLEARSVSRYASMEDVKGLILAANPGLDMSCWSLRRERGGGAVASVEGLTIRIPPEDMESVTRDHVDTAVYECCRECLDLPLGWEGHPWLEGLLPGYLDRALLMKLFRARAAYGRDGAEGRLSEYTDGYSYSQGPPDVIGFLCDCLGARRRGEAVWVRVTD